MLSAEVSKDRKPSGVKLKHIGRYTLLESLGQGSFATVKKAVDRNTGQNYAVKIVEKKKILGEGLELQLKREVTIMLNLKHENIVRMYEVLQSENNVYLVIELVTGGGGDLFDVIKASKRLDEKMSRHYFQQLIIAVHICHTNGIAHRDLKPENVLISEGGVLKIADFGLANLQKNNEYLKTVCGTPNYVAPEVLKQTEYDGFKSDMWSCGVMLYVMLAGRLPFYQKQLPELVMKIKAGDYKMPETILPEAADLIQKLLNVDPDLRYTVRDVCNHPWFRQDGWDDARLECSPIKDVVASSINTVDDDAKSPTSGAADLTGESHSGKRSSHIPPPVSLPTETGLLPGVQSPGGGDSPSKCLIPPVNNNRSPQEHTGLD
jgi:serine/threonine protein kinase